MAQLHYILIKTSKDPSKQKKIYIKYGETRVPSGFEIFEKDWNKRQKLPKSGRTDRNQLEELLNAINLKVRNKPPEAITTKKLKELVFKYFNDEISSSGPKYPVRDIWETFKNPRYNKRVLSWKDGRSNSEAQWKTWWAQTDLMCETVFGKDFVLAFDRDVLTWEASDKIMDWVETYHPWGKNSTRNRWISKFRELIVHSQSTRPELLIPIGRFPLLSVDQKVSEQPTIEEVRHLKNFKFEKLEHIIVRDLFILGCYLGQHITDFLKYDSENLEIIDGNYFINGTRSKLEGRNTSTYYTATLLKNDHAKRLWDEYIPYSKWTSKIPGVDHSQYKIKMKINKTLKEIFKLAELDRDIEGDIGKGGHESSEVGSFPLHKVITWKMCRRVASTLYREILDKELYENALGHTIEESDKSYTDLKKLSKDKQKKMLDQIPDSFEI